MPISALPDDVEALKRLVLVREADLADARARQSSSEALIAHLRLTIEKMRRDVYGQRSERGARLLDQMELEFEELEAAASEDELAAERAAAAADTTVRSFTRKRPSRKPFAEHLPRERIIVPGPTACTCCGSTRLAKLGEDVSETLEVVPRQWKVLQVRSGEVHVPVVRGDLASAGAVPCVAARLCRRPSPNAYGEHG